MTPLLLFLLFTLIFSDDDIVCPDFDTRVIAGQHYSFSNIAVTWSEAATICSSCVSDGLADIPNSVAQSDIPGIHQEVSSS